MCFFFWYLKLPISYPRLNLSLLWATLLRTLFLLLTWMNAIAEKIHLLLTTIDLIYITPNILPSQITSSYLTDLQGSTSCKPPTTYLLSLYTSWSLLLISNLPQCSTSNLIPYQDVKPSWFPKPCYTSTHWYLLLYPSLNSTLLVKLVVHDLRIRSCSSRDPKHCFLTFKFISQPAL